MNPLDHYLNEISLSTHPRDHPIVLPPPGEAPQYVGMLRDLDSNSVCIYFHSFSTYTFQIVPYYPILWFYEDDVGGWLQLRFKLRLNGLFLADVRTFACHACSLDYLVDMANSFEGNFTLRIPSCPMPFSDLMDELDLLSLIDI